ncbi:uncharacterized protein LOC120845408 [Ixodes scapularis]|uniref:uncharacterized protein LOC115314518 n=1 Tax=Ixodes scapularis TaxID=6945 RepID=UPI001A9DC2FC|nr:uncharacterized protein LOC115314518 [Ixodes scapularis]XP_040073147.1 uncharacterized protein LOC120845408 [Ixodes scapularis]
MPGLLEAMQSRLEAAPAVVNAGVPEDVGPPMRFGTIILAEHRLRRLSSTPSIYTQELAAMVFGCDTLANSCLRGSLAGGGKEVLCKDAVSDIIAHVVAKFPDQTESSVRAYLRRKCNNASSALKKNGGGSQARLFEDACD